MSPYLAIFYDGYNDTISALMNNAAGLTYHEDERRREFNFGNVLGHGAVPWSALARTLLRRFVQSLALGRIAFDLAAKLSPRLYADLRNVPVRPFRRTADASHDSTLEGAIAHTYLANVQIVRGIAKQYGFRCLFYWQSWLGDKYPLSGYERSQMADLLSGEKEFLAGVHLRVQESDRDRVIRSLTDVFQNTAQPCFIDDVHLSEEGNRLVAQRMLPGVLDAIEQIETRSKLDRSQPEKSAATVGAARGDR